MCPQKSLSIFIVYRELLFWLASQSEKPLFAGPLHDLFFITCMMCPNGDMVSWHDDRQHRLHLVKSGKSCSLTVGQCPMLVGIDGGNWWDNFQCPMFNVQCPMSNVQCPMSNVSWDWWRQLSGTRRAVTGAMSPSVSPSGIPAWSQETHPGSNGRDHCFAGHPPAQRMLA